MNFRAEVEYRVRRVVYLDAESKEEARKLAQDTTEWIDALTPNELTGTHDRILVKSVKKEG